MRPVLFHIFSVPVQSYGFMLAVAFLIAIFGLGKDTKKYDINFDTIIDLAFWVIIGAVVGARLVYVITEYRYFLTMPWWEIFRVYTGGLAFHGGLLGGFIAGYTFIKLKKLYPWTLADVVAPYIALGYAIVRIGCLLNGCCYGKVTSLPWAIPCAAGDHLLRHPTQIYSLLGSLIIFGILWLFRNHRYFHGFSFVLYIGLYSIERFIVEIFRETPYFSPWLSLAQVVCIITGIGSFGLIWWQMYRQKKGSAGQDATQEIHH